MQLQCRQFKPHTPRNMCDQNSSHILARMSFEEILDLTASCCCLQHYLVVSVCVRTLRTVDTLLAVRFGYCFRRGRKGSNLICVGGCVSASRYRTPSSESNFGRSSRRWPNKELHSLRRELSSLRYLNHVKIQSDRRHYSTTGP